MSTDTTNLRMLVANARSRYAEMCAMMASPPMPNVTVRIAELEAVLAELDQLRAAGRKDDALEAQRQLGIATSFMQADALRAVPAQLKVDMDTENPNGQDASIGRTVDEPRGYDARGAVLAVQSALRELEAERDAIKQESLLFQSHCASVVKERDDLMRENLELRSRTVFPKAALAAKLAETIRASYDTSGLKLVEANAAVVSALHAYEKEDAEHPFVPAPATERSTQPCSTCGIHHVLGEFEPGKDKVIVMDSNHKLFGWEGDVDSWSQYGSPVTYRVIFGRNRDSFDPCQLRKA